MAADARALGLAPPPRPKDLLILPMNWDALRLFTRCTTQWRHGPNGQPTGLDYAGCKAVARVMGIRFKAAFQGLQVMETESIRLIAEDVRERRGR